MVSELRNLTKPAKVIAVVVAVLFALFGFLAKETYFKITGSSADAQAAISKLERDKLDKTEYEKDCAITQQAIGMKVNRTEYEARHGELLSRINDTNEMTRALYQHQLGKQYRPKEVR